MQLGVGITTRLRGGIGMLGQALELGIRTWDLDSQTQGPKP